MKVRITPEKLAKLWGCGSQTIRVGMQNGDLPIGKAVKNKNNYTYLIFAEKTAELMGITREELMERLQEVEQ